MGQNLNALKHGKSTHPLYGVWKAMINRCTNPKNVGFKNYGGRGIKVCERWMDLESFWADMRPTWKQGLSIDRIDVNGNYEPGNCRWATARQQTRNRRDHIDPTLRKDLNEAGLQYSHYKCRLYQGWSDERARHTPLTR